MTGKEHDSTPPARKARQDGEPDGAAPGKMHIVIEDDPMAFQPPPEIDPDEMMSDIEITGEPPEDEDFEAMVYSMMYPTIIRW